MEPKTSLDGWMETHDLPLDNENSLWFSHIFSKAPIDIRQYLLEDTGSPQWIDDHIKCIDGLDGEIVIGFTTMFEKNTTPTISPTSRNCHEAWYEARLEQQRKVHG